MYELWDGITNNMIDTFETVSAADRTLSSSVQKHGLTVLSGLFLLFEDNEENVELIAEGEAMLVAIKRLAAEERAASHTPPANHRQVG